MNAGCEGKSYKRIFLLIYICKYDRSRVEFQYGDLLNLIMSSLLIFLHFIVASNVLLCFLIGSLLCKIPEAYEKV